jgi:phage/plasmid-associated DNA primase
MVIFECKKPFPKDEVVLEFAGRLSEDEGPAIMHWLMQARAEYLREGLSLPQSMVDARDAYLNSQDALRRFIEEQCQFDREAKTPSHDLFDQWRAWRELEGLPYALSGTCSTFCRSLLGHELCEGRVTGRFLGSRAKRVRTICGLRLRIDDEEEDMAAE